MLWNVEKGGYFADEFRSRRRLGIEVGIEVLGEEVLGILREERGTVGSNYGEGFLRESDPVHEVSVVLDVLNTDKVAMEFIVGGDQRSWWTGLW